MLLCSWDFGKPSVLIAFRLATMAFQNFHRMMDPESGYLKLALPGLNNRLTVLIRVLELGQQASRRKADQAMV
jgi:hypothetical protein